MITTKLLYRLSNNSFLILLLYLGSCNQKKGIEGNNNNNNNIYIGEKITVQEAPKIENNKTNYDITTNGIGGLELGMILDTVRNFYSINKGYKVESVQGTHESDEMDFISIRDKSGDYLLLLYFDNNFKINKIVATSSKFRTYNGVYPGMTIGEFQKIYSSEERIYYNDFESEEFFLPFDLQTKTNRCKIIVAFNDNDKIGTEYPPYYEMDSLGEAYTTKYKTIGTVKAVSVTNY